MALEADEHEPDLHLVLPNPSQGSGGCAPPPEDMLVQAVIDDLAVAALIVSDKGDLVAVNPEWSVLTGFVPEVTHGRGWLEAIRHEDRRGAVALARAACETEVPISGQWRLLGTDHSPSAWVEVRARHAVAIDLPCCLITLTDITPNRLDAEGGGSPLLLQEPDGADAAATVLLAGLGTSQPGAVLCVGLDGLAWADEQAGEIGADSVLQIACRRMGAELGTGDTVHLGGHTLATLYKDPMSAAEAARLGRRMVEVLGEPYLATGSMITVSVSVGIALADETDEPPLLRRAERAMARAQQRGGGWLLADDTDGGSAELEIRHHAIERMDAAARSIISLAGDFALIWPACGVGDDGTLQARLAAAIRALQRAELALDDSPHRAGET